MRQMIILSIFLLHLNCFAQKFNKFTCKTDPKCKGVEFSINYPSNFTIVEGERPNIVKQFYYKDSEEYGNIISLYLRKLPFEPNEIEINEMLSKDLLNMFNPEKIIDYDENAQIESLKCLTSTIYSKGKIYTSNVFSIVNTNMFIWKDNLIQVNFTVISYSDNYSQLLKNYYLKKELFNEIMLSFVLISKWK